MSAPPPLFEVRTPSVRLRLETAKGGLPVPERPPHFQVLRAREIDFHGLPFSPPVTPPALHEEVTYQLTIERLRGAPDCQLTIRTADDQIFTEIVRRSPDYPLWSGPIKLRGYVGDLAFDVLFDGARVLSVLLEVFPTKLSYLEDYQALLDSVASYERTLPFRMVAPTTVAHALGDRTERSLVEWLAVLRWHQDDIAAAARSVLRNPHQGMRSEALVRPAALVRRASSRASSWLARHPQFATVGSFPDRLIDERRILTHNTPENRWLAGRTRRWRRRLQRILRDQPRLAPGLDTVRQALDSLVEDPRFRELTPDGEPCSHILQHRSDYRMLTRLDRNLRRALTRERAGQVPLTLKSLPLLYEYWVLLEVHATLVEELGFRPLAGGPPAHRGSYDTDLQEQGRLDYAGPDGAVARLTYEGLFHWNNQEELESPAEHEISSLHSLTSKQHPDGLLVVELEHRPWPICVVIDAKYRLSKSQEGPRVADVNAMHRYRDALLLRRQLGAESLDVAYGVTKAWFVYPGDPTGLPEDPRLSLPPDKKHRARLWQTAMAIGVGAIPALPGKAALLRRALQIALTSSSAELERSRPRTVHESAIALDSEAPCLWAVVDSADRLEAHKQHRLYHVPTAAVGEPEAVQFVMIGIRHKLRAKARQVEYPAFLFRCEFVGRRLRSDLPENYIETLGPSRLAMPPRAYWLFRLRDRLELSRAAVRDADAASLFKVTPLGEVLQQLHGSSAREP